MFDWVSPEFSPFIGVAVLGFLFMAIASLIQKYRNWQAEKMSRANALLRGAVLLEQAQQHLQGKPVPREVNGFCRQELQERYKRVLELFPDYPGLAERIERAEQGSGRETNSWEPPELEGAGDVGPYVMGLTCVVDYMSSHPPLMDLDAERARMLRERLRILRAETRFGFHNTRVRQAAGEGNWVAAKKEALKLMGFLKEKAPANTQGKTMYHQTLELYRCLEHRELPERMQATDGDSASKEHAA